MAATLDVRLYVRGDKATIANIYAMRKDVVAEIKYTNIRTANDMRELTHQLCPKDTWFMAEHIRVEHTPDYRAFEVYWDPEDFEAEGLEFYPPFVEFGTSKQRAQPSLGPAYDALSPHYSADISRNIKKALRAASARGSRVPK